MTPGGFTSSPIDPPAADPADPPDVAPAPLLEPAAEADFGGDGSAMPPAAPAPVGTVPPSVAPAPAAPVPATASARSHDGLLADLLARPWSFDFFQAVRRLENVSHGKPPIGTSTRVADDSVRFGQAPSLRFEPATVGGFRPAADGRPPMLVVQFLGLCGPFGPMPLHVTEYLRDRERNHADAAPARFFDVFNHRMIASFYRAWAVNQQTVSFERSARRHAGSRGRWGDHYAVYVASLFGLGMESMRERDAAPHLAKLFFAGRFASQTKNAEGLAAVLEGYFGIPVRIEQFIGQWLALPDESRCRLGASPETCTLGGTAVVGSSTWQCQHRFRVRLGPMCYDDYRAFLPRAEKVKALAAFVRGYVGDELAWELQLVLRAREVPGLRLGRVGHLGWTSWLGTKSAGADVEDLIFEPSPN